MDEYGWPFRAVTVCGFGKDRRENSADFAFIHYPALALNIVIGLAMPIASLFACEFVLGRYAPRRKVE